MTHEDEDVVHAVTAAFASELPAAVDASSGGDHADQPAAFSARTSMEYCES